MSWYTRARNSNDSQLASPGTILSLVMSFGAMALAIFAHDYFQWTWLLVLAIALAFFIFGIFIWALWRDMRGHGEPSLFAPAINVYQIGGPPSRIFFSMATLGLVGLFGVYALVMGRAYALVPEDGVALLEGMACRLYGLGCLLTSVAGFVRFHTSWRRAHAFFGIVMVLAMVSLIAALIVYEDG